MKLIDWNDIFKIGVEEIDNQHKLLVDNINNLYDAILENKEESYTKEILSRLFHYIDEHFKTEEELMDKINYAYKEKHKAEHNQFAQEIIELTMKLHKDEVVIANELLLFLKDWLTEHVLNSDKKLGFEIRNSTNSV